jgi:hypothetical protein
MDMLESVQYQAGPIVTGCWKNTSLEKLYKELGWESLSERRNFRRLLKYHKILSNKAPAYLNGFVSNAPPHPHSTDHYNNTFFPYCFTKWSTPDPNLKCLKFNKFKSSFCSSIRPTKGNTFDFNDRYDLKLLSCIQADHSALRSHRFSKQFNCTDPTCWCVIGDETSEHYFLLCPALLGPRTVLLNKVSEILQQPSSDIDDPSLCQLLLHGNPSLDVNSNKSIICASIKFIKDSKIFKTFKALKELNIT